MERVSSADMHIERSEMCIVSTDINPYDTMPHHVYILYSKKLDRFYIGVTRNLSRRLVQHNNKETTSTANGVPWILIWTTSKETRRKAEILERKLKNLTRRRKIRFMLEYKEGIREATIDFDPGTSK